MGIPRTRMARSEAVYRLIQHGFVWGDPNEPIAVEAALRRFQTAYGGPEGKLKVDGVLGPHTSAALRGLPWLSPHFRVEELWDRRERRTQIHRELLSALEAVRLHVLGNRPLSLVSAYRTPATNRAVGGAGRSQHMSGTAADLRTSVPYDAVKELRLFSGIGRQGDRALHVDVRHVLPATARGATVIRPALWSY